MKRTVLLLLAALLMFTVQVNGQWSITAVDTDFTIDFVTTVSGVNNGAYVGTGFTNTPAEGQLHAGAWKIFGASDGEKDFDVEATTGDFARGTSLASTSGGLYGYEVETGNRAFGFLASNADFAPGYFVLKIQNNTGEAVNYAKLSYDVWVYNNGGRSSLFNGEISLDGVNFIPVEDFEFETPEVADAEPEWVKTTLLLETSIPVMIEDGEFLYIRWYTANNGGSGTRDRIALDNIILNIKSLNYTVTFDIKNTNNEVINDAIITFDGIEYAPGEYEITVDAANAYDYTVTRNGFIAVTDQVIVTEDITENVTLTNVAVLSLVDNEITLTLNDEVGTFDGHVIINGARYNTDGGYMLIRLYDDEDNQLIFADVFEEFSIDNLHYHSGTSNRIFADFTGQQQSGIWGTQVLTGNEANGNSLRGTDLNGAIFYGVMVDGTLGTVAGISPFAVTETVELNYLQKDNIFGEYKLVADFIVPFRPGDAGATAGFYTYAEFANLEPFATIEKTIKFDGYTISFDVKDADNQIIPDAIITFDGVEYPAGTYTFEDLLPGDYDYSIYKYSYVVESGTIHLTADYTENVHLPKIALLSLTDNEITLTLNDAIGTFEGHVMINGAPYNTDGGYMLIRLYDEDDNLLIFADVFDEFSIGNLHYHSGTSNRIYADFTGQQQSGIWGTRVLTGNAPNGNSLRGTDLNGAMFYGVMVDGTLGTVGGVTPIPVTETQEINYTAKDGVYGTFTIVADFVVPFRPGEAGASAGFYTYAEFESLVPYATIQETIVFEEPFDCVFAEFPFIESFEDTDFPPECWLNIKTAGTGTPGTWNRVTSGSYPTASPQSGTAMAMFNCFNYTSGTRAILVSPIIDFPNENYVVSFWMYRDGGYPTNADRVNVYYNTTDDLTDAQLLGTVNRSRDFSPVVAANGWYQYNFAVPEGISGNSYIIFEGVSAFGNNIFVDNIVVRETSNENNILSFVLAQQTGEAAIDADAKTVDIEVFSGTILESLTPTITVSVGASIDPESGTEQDFSNSFVYTVTSESNIDQEWTVNVSLEACPAPTAIMVQNITDTQADVTWTASGGTDTWNIKVSDAAINPATDPGNIADETTSAIPYPISGLEAQTQYFVYIQTECGGNQSAWQGPITFTTECGIISEFPFIETFASTSETKDCWTVLDVNNDGDLWNLNYTSNPFVGDMVAAIYTDLNSGNNNDYLISPRIMLTGSEVLSFHYRVQSSGEPNDFSVLLSTTGTDPADFTTVLLPTTVVNNTTYQQMTLSLTDYTGEVFIAWHVAPGGLDGWRLYVDNVIVREASHENDILTFTLPQQTGDAVIDTDAKTVEIEVQMLTDLSELTPTITVSNFATISPLSGTTQDFSTPPFTYTVTAESGITQDWLVTVTESLTQSSENDILTFTFPQQTGDAVIDTDAKTVEIEVVWTANITNLIPTITVSQYALINPASGVARDFSNSVTYTVTAEDDSEAIWTVNVSQELAPLGANCNNPILVSLPAGSPYTETGQTNCGLGNIYSGIGCGASYFNGEDIIYQIEITEASLVTVQMTSTTTYTGIAILDACPGVGSCIAFSTISGVANHNFQVALQPGIYYMIIDTWPSPFCIPSFNLTLTADTEVCLNPSNLAVIDLWQEEATIGWNPGLGETSWNIKYDNQTFDPETEGTLIEGVNNPHPLINLTHDTDYWVYVQAICGGNFSAWVGPLTFTTLDMCATPTTLTANNVTDQTALLGWNAVGGTSVWNLEIGTTGFLPGTGAQLFLHEAIENNPFFADGFTEQTTYEFYVQADCSGDLSEWAGPFAFTTGCAIFSEFPFIETFASTSETKECWTVLDVNNDGDLWNLNYASNPFVGDMVAAIYTDFNSGNNNDYLISPRLMLTGNEILTFHYRVQSAGEPNDFSVLLSTTGTNPADFTTVLLPTTVVSNVTYQQMTISLTDYTGEVFIAWHVAPGGLDGWRLYIDNVIVREPSDENDIIAFSIPEQIGISDIDVDNHTVTVEVPLGTDKTNLTPTISVSLGAQINPESGIAQDFTDQFEYTVTSELDTPQVWTIFVEEEACAAPSGLYADNLTETTADIFWTATGDTDTWQIKVSDTPINPNTQDGNIVANETVTSIPFELTDLTGLTTYHVYIRTDCDGVYSAWINAQFTTDCYVFGLPFSEDFTGITSGTIPQCWDRTHNNWGTFLGSNAGGVSPEMRFNWTPSSTAQFKLFTPMIDGTSVDGMELSFKHYVDWFELSFTVKVEISTDGNEWTEVWSKVATSDIMAETITVNLNEYAGSEFMLAWVFDGNSFNTDGWFIDDINVYEVEVIYPQIAVIDVNNDVMPVNVCIGTDEADVISQLTSQITISDTDDVTHVVDLNWTIDAYDADVVTTYTATGTFTLPVGVVQTDPETELIVSTQVIVHDLPIIECPENMDVCFNDEPFALAGATPVGGVYSGDGVTDGVFNPSNGTSLNMITYTYTDPVSNCVVECTFTINVNPQPIVTCPEYDIVTVNAPITLTGASPEGGVYSGTNVIEGVFNPNGLEDGDYVITYTYLDPVTDCENSCEFTITLQLGVNIITENSPSISVYPNPNTGNFIIDFSNIEGKVKYSIYDTKGSIITSEDFVNYGENSKEFNLDVAPGIYYIKLTNANETIIEKIIIQ